MKKLKDLKRSAEIIQNHKKNGIGDKVIPRLKKPLTRKINLVNFIY